MSRNAIIRVAAHKAAFFYRHRISQDTKAMAGLIVQIATVPAVCAVVMAIAGR